MESDHYDDIFEGAKRLRGAEAWRDGLGTIRKQAACKQGSWIGNDEAIEVIGILIFIRREIEEGRREETGANGEETIELTSSIGEKRYGTCHPATCSAMGRNTCVLRDIFPFPTPSLHRTD